MRRFSLKLSDSFVRTLNKQQYKDATHWLRLTARQLDKTIVWETLVGKTIDAMLYGEKK